MPDIARLPATVLLLCLLGGCAMLSPIPRERRPLDRYVGGQVGDLVQAWGVPTESFKRDDESWVYTWRTCRIYEDFRGRWWRLYCETRVNVENGLVANWKQWGNDCP